MSDGWTDDEAIAHGREWLANDAGWPWLPGQAYLSISKDGRIERGFAFESQLAYDGRPVNRQWEAIPDMRNPGTRGHALAQVREALGDPDLHAARTDKNAPRNAGRWFMTSGDRQRYRPVSGYQDTESEALLAARRAAT